MSDEDHPLGSLAGARAAPDGVVILEGDWGGQIYVVAPASRVSCDEAALARLLRAIDAIAWPGSEAQSATIRYERLRPGETVPGGMGGGRVLEGAWIHDELAPQAQAIREVLAGRRAHLAG
jgi:hypothetical protein